MPIYKTEKIIKLLEDIKKENPEYIGFKEKGRILQVCKLNLSKSKITVLAEIENDDFVYTDKNKNSTCFILR